LPGEEIVCVPFGGLLKITIFGLTLSSSWGNGHATPYRALLRALHQQGAEITFYEKDAPYYARHRDFTSCNFCQLEIYGDWPSIRRHALEHARTSDIVLSASYCADGALICDEILGLDGPLRVFYDLDTPITLKNLADGTCPYLRREQIAAFDLYLSFTGGSVLDRLQAEYGARLAMPLYGCVDPDEYLRVPARREFSSWLSYLGTYSADRQDKVDDLFLEPARRYKNRRFLLAGSLYPGEWTWPHNVKRCDHVPPADHAALYSSSRATLNVTRDGMAESGYCPSGRFFEAAACGTPILTDWFEGLDSFFDLERDLCVVRSPEDVISRLQLPDGELCEVAARARGRTLEDHTGQCRAIEFLRSCEEAYGSQQIREVVA
jgi:spore maturation protein CgeB